MYSWYASFGKMSFSVGAAETKIKNRATLERGASCDVREEDFSKDDLLEKSFPGIIFELPR